MIVYSSERGIIAICVCVWATRPGPADCKRVAADAAAGRATYGAYDQIVRALMLAGL